ncbi:hypothetical protein GmHk_18G050514 [Glycine max]|nr:hypothetical protein GmHk_18G050514 [Glycine max]
MAQHHKFLLTKDISNDSQTFGIGMCLRDSQGNFIKAKSATIQEHTKPEVAEAWALHQSINWIKRSTTPELVLQENQTYLQRCRASISSIPNSNSRVSVIKRRGNQATHNLARVSRFYVSFGVFNYIPTCIVSHVMNEM